MLNKDIINKIFVYTNNYNLIKDFYNIMYSSTIKHLLKDISPKLVQSNQAVTRFTSYKLKKDIRLKKINWNKVSTSGGLTINFIMKFAEQLDWISLCKSQEFSIAELELFIHRLDSGLEDDSADSNVAVMPRYNKFLPYWGYISKRKFTITLVINIYRISFTTAFKHMNPNYSEKDFAHNRMVEFHYIYYVPNLKNVMERYCINHLNVKDYLYGIIDHVDLSSMFLNKYKDYIEKNIYGGSLLYLVSLRQKLSLDFIRENKEKLKPYATTVLQYQVLDKPLIIYFLKNIKLGENNIYNRRTILNPSTTDILYFCIPDHSARDNFIRKYGA